MMAYRRNANSVGKFSINKVIRKSLQVRAMIIPFNQMKSAGSRRCHVDETAQLSIELIA